MVMTDSTMMRVSASVLRALDGEHQVTLPPLEPFDRRDHRVDDGLPDLVPGEVDDRPAHRVVRKEVCCCTVQVDQTGDHDQVVDLVDLVEDPDQPVVGLGTVSAEEAGAEPVDPRGIPYPLIGAPAGHPAPPQVPARRATTGAMASMASCWMTM